MSCALYRFALNLWLCKTKQKIRNTIFVIFFSINGTQELQSLFCWAKKQQKKEKKFQFQKKYRKSICSFIWLYILVWLKLEINK